MQNMASATSRGVQALALLAMLDGTVSQRMETTRVASVTANASAHLQRVSGIAGVRLAPDPATFPRLVDICSARKTPCEIVWQLLVLERMPFFRVYLLWESPF